MPAGRPSKYGPEILDKTATYLEKWSELGKGIIPSVAGLAIEIGVTRETCHEWAKDEGKEEFSNMLKELAQIQERTLLENGLSGDFNPTITKLVLSKHNYHDTAKVDAKVETTELTEDQIDAAIQRRLAQNSEPAS